MDLVQTISDLRAEVNKIKAAISHLESLNGADPVEARSRRGRKFMGEVERREVSVRMKRYWASRRQMRGTA